MRRGLEREGFVVLEGENGLQALALCEEYQPDLVIMDCMMPVMDGFTACNQLQSSSASSSCQVLMLTGLEDSQSLEMALQAGAVDLISKPVNWRVLGPKIRRIMALSRTERLLGKSESLTRSVMEGLLDGIIVIDAANSIVSFNPAAEKIFGCRAGEVTGRNITALMEGVPDLSAGCLQTRTFNVRREIEGRRKDGSRFTVACSVSGVPSGDRLLTVRDISRQKETEKDLRRSILEAVPIPVFFKGLDGSLLGVNRAYETFHGIFERDIIGKSVHDIMPSGLAAIHEALDRELLVKGGTQAYEAQTVAADGQIRDIMVCKSTFDKPNGQLGGLIGTVTDISERKAAEKRIHRLSQMYLALARTNDIIAFAANEETLLSEVCRIAVENGEISMSWIGVFGDDGFIQPVASFGYGTEYLDGIVISSHEDIPEGNGPVGVAVRTNRPAIVENYTTDERLRPWHERGSRHGWKASASFPVPRGGKPYGVLSVNYIEDSVFDETILELLNEMAKNLSRALDRFDQAEEHRRTVASLAESENFSRGLIESTHEGVCVWNADELITFVNQRAAEMFGYQAEEESLALGQPIRRFLLPENMNDYNLKSIEHRIGKSSQFERRARHKSGNEIWLLVSATPRFDRDGKYLGGFAMFTDITERKAAQERIEHLAHFDNLTGLPNRSLLAERFMDEVYVNGKSRTNCAMIFLDLDHFKNINDTLGHHVGDQLLIAIARRLEAAVRKQDTVARLGGDEFILLLPGVGADGAVRLAQNLLGLVARPIHVEQYELTATPSIGIAVYPTDGADLEILYKCADIAMYEAKRGGRNCWRLFAPEMQQHSERQVHLLAALRRALENGELMLYYQPQVSLRDGTVVGVEALLRWRQLSFGMVSPAEFIPLAEESGLILPIGEWVLRTAVRQMKTWIEEGMTPLTVAVNLSPIQLHQPSLPRLVREILQDSGLPGRYLELELTESVAMKESEITTTMMDALDQLGVRMAIDDFGTGYSSLAYLKRFRSYKLKIDQSFVRNIVTDMENQVVVNAIINLANSLNMRTIAEGVENEEQLRYLHKNGCEEVQGYYFSRPLPPELFFEWMRRRTLSPQQLEPEEGTFI